MASPCDAEGEKQFEARMNAMLDISMSSLCVCLGHRLGLFDLLIKLREPQTPQQLAKAAGMKTRYVEEWIGAVFCANILEVDKSGSEDRYFLPPHRIPYMMSKEHTAMSEIIPLVAGVYEDLVKCFPVEGPRGIPYERYPYFNEWRRSVGQAIYKPPFLREVLQKYQKLEDKMNEGVRILSIGCNTGTAEIALAKMYPASTFLGVDITEDGIATATQTAQDEGLSNISFKVQDACNMPADWSESFDIVVAIDVLHDVPFTTKCIAECFRVLKEDGLFVVLDIEGHTRISDNRSTAFSAALYSCSLFHCMPVSLNIEGGEGLGSVWGVEKATKMLECAGFHLCCEADITKQFNHLYVCGKNKK